MVVGRLVLGLPSAFGLTVIVLIWSALTGAGLGFIRACLFSLVAVAIREIIDASAHRLIMRAWRSRDSHGLLLTSIAATCPAVAGFLAARLLAQERIHQPQPIPPEYVTADFRDARKHLPGLRRIALTHAAP